MNNTPWSVKLAVWAGLLAGAGTAAAQVPTLHHGEAVPRDVREMYDRGLQYLANKQSDGGDWSDGYQGPGTTGMALMVFLAAGEDPDFGRYRNNVRRALRSIISAQDGVTGYMGNSMYHHGFAMLGLAEAYGAVDDRDLWSTAEPSGERSLGSALQSLGRRFVGGRLIGGPSAGPPSRRTIGEALELAVRQAVTAQKKNPLGAWRYSPEATDADTSVSGAVLVGLLAARNAGIEVPDTAIEKAIAYYKSMTSDFGQVAYSGMGGFGESTARSSIAALVYALARRKDLPQYSATVKYLTQVPEPHSSQYREYTRYYQAQALFQGNVEAWGKWNKQLIRQLKASQRDDGSFTGQFGASTSTSLSLLALALNYRLLPIYER